MDITQRLKAQNNGTPWRDCEDRDLAHVLRGSARIAHADSTVSVFQHCRRCPVGIRTVEEGEQDPDAADDITPEREAAWRAYHFDGGPNPNARS